MNWIDEFHQATKQSFAYMTLLGYEAHYEHYSELGSCVRFTGNRLIEITVIACPVRLELDVTISGVECCGVTSLYELELIYPNAELPVFEFGIYEAHQDMDKLRVVLGTLAKRFRIIALPFLRGEKDWKSVSEWRDLQQHHKRIAELTQQISLAFAEKRWDDVIVAASELGADAGKLELKRLDYASKRLKQPDQST